VVVILSLLTGILFGLAPALQSTRVNVVPALKETRSGEAHSRTRLSLSHALVVAQIGISLVMLVAGGLFLRTLANLQSIELGINRENLLLFNLNARQAGHGDPEIASFYDTLQKRFQAVPGVQSASLSHNALIADGESGTCLVVPGRPPDENTKYLNVGPAFFSTMQNPILLGREIDEHDQARSPGVVVVNEVFANGNFGSENPLGHHLTFGCESSARDFEIIGVSKNAHYGELKSDIPSVIYIPYNQSPVPPFEMTYAVRTAGNPMAIAKTIRDIVHQADPRVPVTSMRTQTTALDQVMGQEIMFARLCSAFALLALVIACVGLYGTMSYNVARRTGEIGIRMALGAQRGAVVGMIVREVFLLAVLGLAIGLPTALAASKLVKSFLFGMNPTDPLALALAVATLLAAALLAGYAPAWRASRIDPMVALRHE
jgi:predicted permease